MKIYITQSGLQQRIYKTWTSQHANKRKINKRYLDRSKIGAPSVRLWLGSYGLLLLSNLVGIRWNTVFLHSAEMLQSWDHRLPHTMLRDISTDTVTQEVIMCCSIPNRRRAACVILSLSFVNEEFISKVTQSLDKCGR